MMRLCINRGICISFPFFQANWHLSVDCLLSRIGLLNYVCAIVAPQTWASSWGVLLLQNDIVISLGSTLVACWGSNLKPWQESGSLVSSTPSGLVLKRTGYSSRNLADIPWMQYPLMTVEHTCRVTSRVVQICCKEHTHSHSWDHEKLKMPQGHAVTTKSCQYDRNTWFKWSAWKGRHISSMSTENVWSCVKWYGWTHNRKFGFAPLCKKGRMELCPIMYMH